MSRQVLVDYNRPIFVDIDGYDRIRAHSPDAINTKIENEICKSVEQLSQEGEEQLTARIDVLDREWDIDRATMAFFATAASTALLLGTTHNKKWLGLIAVQLGFLAYHASVGWCPPVALLRRLGFRSHKEIDAEKYALKTLRGDFRRPAFGEVLGSPD